MTTCAAPPPALRARGGLPISGQRLSQSHGQRFGDLPVYTGQTLDAGAATCTGGATCQRPPEPAEPRRGAGADDQVKGRIGASSDDELVCDITALLEQSPESAATGGRTGGERTVRGEEPSEPTLAGGRRGFDTATLAEGTDHEVPKPARAFQDPDIDLCGNQPPQRYRSRVHGGTRSIWIQVIKRECGYRHDSVGAGSRHVCGRLPHSRSSICHMFCTHCDAQ